MGYDIWTNGTDTYVAESAEQALSLVERDSGSARSEEGWSVDEWSIRTDDQITIDLDDGQGKTTKSLCGDRVSAHRASPDGPASL